MKGNAHSTVLLFCCGIALTIVARPTASPDQSAPSVASVIDGAVSSIEKRVVAVAEAMPEEKYGFVPTNGEFTGVKSFADQITHIADDNSFGYALALGETTPPDSSGKPPTKKTDIVTYVRASFALAHRAAASLSTANIVSPIQWPNGSPTTRLAIIVEEIGHAENHYGQLVEYLRMNGIVPPASRPAKQ